MSLLCIDVSLHFKKKNLKYFFLSFEGYLEYCAVFQTFKSLVYLFRDFSLNICRCPAEVWLGNTATYSRAVGS
jgi:hypothetical protein